MWMIVTLDTELDWPMAETVVEFEGQQLILRPAEAPASADIRVRYEHPQEELAAYETICRFLSVMSWWNRRPARPTERICCTAPIRGGKVRVGPPGWPDFNIEDGIQAPSDPKAKLALALYREAASVHNTAYEFLGYFKIINILYSSGKDQIAWINATLNQIKDRDALKRIAELQAHHSDLGDYLYSAGRCAVAHAFSTPTVDPDDPTDVFRLSADMPLLRALVEHLIEVHFGIPNRFST